MDDFDVRSAANILASVKEQESRFEKLTRALEEERRNVSMQLERVNIPSNRGSISNIGTSESFAWQQLVLQVTPPLTLTGKKLCYNRVSGDLKQKMVLCN